MGLPCANASQTRLINRDESSAIAQYRHSHSGPNKAMTFRLDHVSLRVTDIHASTQFYGEVFGWPIVRTSGDPITGQWLDIGGSDTLHLNQGDMSTTAVTKDNHLALRVDGFDAFLARLTEIGVVYYNWAGATNAVGQHPAGFRQIYIQDPDSYWIEINDHTHGLSR